MQLSIAQIGKKRARSVFRGHINQGNIIPPTHCEGCGKRTIKKDAHHVDYNKPLEVIWLCKTCHDKKHDKNDPDYVPPIEVTALPDQRQRYYLKKNAPPKPQLQKIPDKLKKMLADKNISLRAWCIKNGHQLSNVTAFFGNKIKAERGKVKLAIDALNHDFPGWDDKFVPDQKICNKCGHVWLPIIPSPKYCPKCHRAR